MQARTEEELKEANRKYAELDRMINKSCRRDKKDWPMQKAVEAQEAANRGDSKTLYLIVSEPTGTRNMSNIPIKDRSGKPLMRVEEQDERWMQHFRESSINPIRLRRTISTTKKNHLTNLTSTLVISVLRRRKLLLKSSEWGSARSR
ncbi:hypothetical protein ANCDUO_10399 [Ancylostoma duodenale]|uniref:Uncharacterized protein n=1 Tax=Ancylostoma duodenale TaxID=51022 RepID=A0A0C2CRF5_9BILA|nr:hypothetical protein ANCDUO_10399 [Ancylostoma duodenale]